VENSINFFALFFYRYLSEIKIQEDLGIELAASTDNPQAAEAKKEEKK
jgi:hypothetical protein